MMLNYNEMKNEVIKKFGIDSEQYKKFCDYSKKTGNIQLIRIYFEVLVK